MSHKKRAEEDPVSRLLIIFLRGPPIRRYVQNGAIAGEHVEVGKSVGEVL
jgi:hypothetical protein